MFSRFADFCVTWILVRAVRRFCKAVMRSSVRICWNSAERWLI